MVLDGSVAQKSSKEELSSAIRSLLSNGKLELPILPEVSTKLLSMCNDPNVDAPEIAAVIRRDQTIASNLLRIANSAIYSSGTVIVSLQQAIARLGILRIREIVMIISCQNRIFDVKGYEDVVRTSFQCSLGAAAYSQEIARVLRRNVEDAFLCGLLHDIGRPVLLQAFLDSRKSGELDFDRDVMLEVVEDIRIDIGGDLIESWQLPGKIANAVHGQAAASSANLDANLLHLAIDLARMTFHLKDDVSDDEMRHHAMIPTLNLYPDQMTAILEKRSEIFDWVESTI